MTTPAQQIASRITAAAQKLLGPPDDPGAAGGDYVAAVAHGFDVPGYFLAVAELAAQPRTHAIWTLYHRVYRADADIVMRAGLEALLLDPALTAGQRGLIRQVQDLHHWHLWENRRHDHDSLKSRWPTGPDAPPWVPDWDAIDLKGPPLSNRSDPTASRNSPLPR